MFSCLKKSSKPSYYGFVEFKKDVINVVSVNAKTKKIVPELFFVVKEKYQTIKEFIEEIPKIFGKNYIAIIFEVFTFESPEFTNNYKFCEAIKAKLNSIKIPYYFISANDYKVTCLFASAANITVKNQDTVLLCALIKNDQYCIAEYQFTENGYKYISSYYVNSNQEPEIVRQEILRSIKPVKIVAFSLISNCKDIRVHFNKLKSILQKSDNLIFGDFENLSTRIQGIVKISKWILDNTYVKCHIVPKCSREYLIVGKVGNKILPSDILAEANCLLPYETDEWILRSNVEYSLAYTDFDHPEPIYLEPISYSKKCHRSKLFLTIDINHFYNLKIQPIINRKIEYLPDFLNETKETKIPVISFVDNISIICVCKNDGEYKFADQWNGLEGKDLMISFADEEPKFCENAIDDSKMKPSFVVLDLIQIMCMPIDNIKPDLHWCFSFTKDSENPILIEFDNFDGTKTAATPAFLMAMLLKEHLKAIKNEAGKKPKEIAFCFFIKMEDEERSRIQDGLKEACKLLKVECHFIRNEL